MRFVGSVAAVVGAAVVFLGGCGASSTKAASKEPALDAAVMALNPATVDPGRIKYPLSAYASGKDDTHSLGLAVATLEQTCFRRLGLDLPMPVPPDARPFPVYDWYGLWNEDTTRTYGYDSPPIMGAGKPFASVVPPDWLPALSGSVREFHGAAVPEGGCQGEALRNLGFTTKNGIDANLVENLQRDAVSHARNHSAVTARVPAWRTCMANQGYHFNDPADPFQYWTKKGQRTAQPDQISAGLADISCKKQTGLLQAWVAADVAYERQEVERNAPSLQAFNTWRQTVLRNANRVIAGK